MKFKISIFGLCYNFETHVRDLYWLQSRNTVSICQFGVVYIIYSGYFCGFDRYKGHFGMVFLKKSFWDFQGGQNYDFEKGSTDRLVRKFKNFVRKQKFL